MIDRPTVILYVTSSLDSRMTTGPNTTMFKANFHPNLDNILGTPEDWSKFEDRIKRLHPSNLQLEGSNMLIGENEVVKELPDYDGDTNMLYQDFLPVDIVEDPSRKGWLAVVDGRGRLRSGYKGDGTNHMIHLTSHGVDPAYLSFLRSSKIPYLIAGNEQVDLRKVFMKLKEKLDIDTILTSSGGKLAGALIRKNLLDEVNILINPVILGGFDTPTLFDSPELKPPEINPSHLNLIFVEVQKTGQLLVRYKVGQV